MIGCTVCGHRDEEYGIYAEKLAKIFEEIIDMYKDVKFYLGGYGAFDIACAKILHLLKTKYQQANKRCNIILCLVVPYEYQYNHKIKNKGIYDQIVYPITLNDNDRYAIVKRNQYMVDNAQIVISGVNRDYGGAYKTLRYANDEGKTVLSIF